MTQHSSTPSSPDYRAQHVAHRPAGWMSVLAAAALLAACGGGGSEQASTPVTPPAATNPVPPVVVNNYELQTTVPAPTYAAGSWQEFVFNYLNDNRSRCGFGKVAQDAALDKAAQGHSEYISRDMEDQGRNYVPSLSIHEQVEGRPGFTGKSVFNRATAAGYTGWFVSEQVALGYTRSETASRMAHVHERMQSLLSAPYHMDLMISYTRQIGLGMKNYTPAENPNNDTLAEALVINPGYQRFEQASTTEVLTYPCDGTNDVSEGLYGEMPDPTSGTGLVMPVGPAILVAGPYGKTLKVTSVSVVPVSRLDGSPLGTLPSFNLSAAAPAGVLVLDRDTDTVNKSVNDRAKAFLLTHKPLEMGVNYKVELGMTVNGEAKTRSFTFSTRTSNPRATMGMPRFGNGLVMR